MKSTPIRRGDLWWVSLDPTQGSEIKKTRPCLILSHDTLNRLRKTVVVIPFSTGASVHPPITVSVSCQGKKGVAIIDQIRAVAKHRLKGKIETIDSDELEAVENAVTEILELTR